MGRWVLSPNISAKVINPLLGTDLVRKSLKDIKDEQHGHQIIFGKWEDIVPILKYFDNNILPYDLTEQEAIQIHSPLLHYVCDNHNIVNCERCDKKYREHVGGYETSLTEAGKLAHKWAKDRKIKTNITCGACDVYYLDVRKIDKNWTSGFYEDGKSLVSHEQIYNVHGLPYKIYELELCVWYCDNPIWDERYPY
jgi:hypothetical protein